MAPPHALVVDDDPDGREALAELLESHGYAVRQAENGKVAVQLVGEWSPCLMLLDLEMPVMTGWEVLACIDDVAPCGAIVVVVLSAAAAPPPDVPFVRKPCDVGLLLATIDRCFEAAGPH
jgi:CheY-like chemotaxis protein